MLVKEVKKSNAKLKAYKDNMKKLKEEENSLSNPGYLATFDTLGDAPATNSDNLEALTDKLLGITENMVCLWLCFPLATLC